MYIISVCRTIFICAQWLLLPDLEEWPIMSLLQKICNELADIWYRLQYQMYRNLYSQVRAMFDVTDRNTYTEKCPSFLCSTCVVCITVLMFCTSFWAVLLLIGQRNCHSGREVARILLPLWGKIFPLQMPEQQDRQMPPLLQEGGILVSPHHRGSPFQEV